MHPHKHSISVMCQIGYSHNTTNDFSFLLTSCTHSCHESVFHLSLINLLFFSFRLISVNLSKYELKANGMKAVKLKTAKHVGVCFWWLITMNFEDLRKVFSDNLEYRQINAIWCEMFFLALERDIYWHSVDKIQFRSAVKLDWLFKLAGILLCSKT